MIIHPTAIVDEAKVSLGENVNIGAYAIIENGASIGDNTVIEPHAKVCTGSRIGKNCRICSFTTIAGEPQDLHFDPSTVSFVEIGDGSVIREGTTIHRATVPNGATKIGKSALMMANSHVGHDTVIGDNAIIGCFSAFAGHIVAGKDIFISGGVMLHQKIRIGDGVIVSGNTASSMDIPPYVIAFGRNTVSGLNIVGLVRRKFSREAIAELKSLYATVYKTTSSRKNAIAALESGLAKTPEGLNFLKFFEPEGRYFLAPRTK